MGFMMVAPARADRLDDLERRAAELVEQLEGELEAVRAERSRLQAERARLEAERAAPVAGEAPSGETNRKVDVLAEELAKVKDEIIVPETDEMTS
jgi:hypothetical protein